MIEYSGNFFPTTMFKFQPHTLIPTTIIDIWMERLSGFELHVCGQQAGMWLWENGARDCPQWLSLQVVIFAAAIESCLAFCTLWGWAGDGAGSSRKFLEALLRLIGKIGWLYGVMECNWFESKFVGVVKVYNSGQLKCLFVEW